MRWSLHRVDAGLGPWAARWDALNQARFGGHPMLSAAFVDGLLRHFPAPSVYLCVAEDDAAMCLLRPQRLGVWTSYLPGQAQVSPSLLDGQLDLRSLLRSLPWHAVQLDLLAVDPLVQGDALHEGGAPPARSTQALTMAVDLGDDDAYWLSRSKKLRDNLRRHERSVGTAGLTARFAEHAEVDAVRQAVDRYAALESAGWKGRQGTALAPGNEQHRFYAELLTQAAARDEARVFELWFGEQLVASRLVLAGPDMAIALKTAYDESFKQQAPGRLLLRQVLQRCHQLWPGRSFEFYTNASPDQLAWSTARREVVNLTIYRHRFWARLADWRRRLQRGRPSDEIQCLTLDEEWPADVQQFFVAAESRRIAYGSDWLRLLRATVFRNAEARIYLLRRDGQLLAALPVILPAGRSIESMSNYYSALYAPVLAPSAGASELMPLIRALRVKRPDCVAMRFAPMDPADPSFAALRGALRDAGLLPFDYFCHGNWYEPVQDHAEDYLNGRAGLLRSTIKRAERRLEAAGAHVEIICSEADIERGILAFESVYSRSWKKPEPYPGFMPGLLRLCAQRGWLRLGLLWLDGQAIAAQLWIVANGRAEIYKLAYAQEHKAMAPGTVLTARLMRHVIDVDGVNEVDYLIGDDPYKAQWMSQRRERWGLVAYNPRRLGGLFGWLRELLVRRLRPRRRPFDPPPRPRG